MAGITLINEDLLLPFTEETPVHANFMNPIIDNVNKNTSAIGQKLDKAKSISLSNNKIMQLGFFNYSSNFNLYARIMRPNLHNGSQLSYADLYLGKYSSSYPVEGKLQTSIDLTQEIYKIRFVITDTGKLYALSPLYNYSEWILIENKGFTEEIKEVSTIVGNIVWDSNNNTIKIATTDKVISNKFTSAKRIIDIVEPGIYQLYDAQVMFTDFPADLTSRGFKYGTLEVIKATSYTSYRMILCLGDISRIIEVFGFAASANSIKWEYKQVADIPLLNGWQMVSGGTGCYVQVKDEVVQIEIMMSNTSQPVATEIANLNTLIGGGANPSRNVFFTSYVRGVGYVGDGYINPLGSIYFSNIPPNIVGKQVVIKVNYIR